MVPTNKHAFTEQEAEKDIHSRYCRVLTRMNPSRGKTTTFLSLGVWDAEDVEAVWDVKDTEWVVGWGAFMAVWASSLRRDRHAEVT